MATAKLNAPTACDAGALDHPVNCLPASDHSLSQLARSAILLTNRRPGHAARRAAAAPKGPDMSATQSLRLWPNGAVRTNLRLNAGKYGWSLVLLALSGAQCIAVPFWYDPVALNPELQPVGALKDWDAVSRMDAHLNTGVLPLIRVCRTRCANHR